MPPEYCKRAEVCVKACGGMQDPAAEIASLREAKRELLAVCEAVRFAADQCALQVRNETTAAAIRHVRAALAKHGKESK